VRRSIPRTASLAALGALLTLASLAVVRAGAEQSGNPQVVVSLDGSISPRHIPRNRPVPVSLTLAGQVRGADGAPPPRLQRIEIAFGARGGLDTAGLPRCSRPRLRNATQRQALDRCRGALVGRGEISTEVLLDPAKPLIARAGVLAFNGRSGGRPAVWVHAYSASPPVSLVLPFHLHILRNGAYGILMRSPVRRALGRWPRLRSFQITLGRRYRVEGEPHSYLSARCPLPPRLSIGIFPLARATYYFVPRPTLTTTILRGCRVRR
jgi:hypothetical protein